MDLGGIVAVGIRVISIKRIPGWGRSDGRCCRGRGFRRRVLRGRGRCHHGRCTRDALGVVCRQSDVLNGKTQIRHIQGFTVLHVEPDTQFVGPDQFCPPPEGRY